MREPRPHLFDELVKLTWDGREISIPRGELIVRKAEKYASEGDEAMANLLLTLMGRIKKARAKSAFDERVTVGDFRDPARKVSGFNDLLIRLGMARKLYAFKSTARMAIEPWLVQSALSRLGERRFTREEQEEIVRSTQTPHNVDWPDWWEAELRGKKRKSAKKRSRGAK